MGANSRRRKTINYREHAEKMAIVISKIRKILNLHSDSSEVPVRKICPTKIGQVQKVILRSNFNPVSVCKVLGVEEQILYPDKM